MYYEERNLMNKLVFDNVECLASSENSSSNRLVKKRTKNNEVHSKKKTVYQSATKDRKEPRIMDGKRRRGTRGGGGVNASLFDER